MLRVLFIFSILVSTANFAQAQTACKNAAFNLAQFSYLTETCKAYSLTREGVRLFGFVKQEFAKCPSTDALLTEARSNMRALIVKGADYSSGCELIGVALDVQSYQIGGPDLVVHPKK
jgi:hypothetical protein